MSSPGAPLALAPGVAAGIRRFERGMMKIERITQSFVAALVMALALAAPATVNAQTSVTSSDIQRLQDDVYQASSDLSRLRSSDPNSASSLQGELDEVREEVIYLKVKLRREGSVPRADYTSVRDRLANLRSRATGDLRSDTSATSADRRGTWSPGQSGSTSGVSGGTQGGVSGGTQGGVSGGTQGGTSGGVSGGTQSGQTGTSTRGSQTGTSSIPAGQEIDVRLQTELSSSTAQVEDRFEATTVVDMFRGDEVLIPAGSVMRGVVRTVEKATRTDRKGQMTVSFDQVTVRGRTYPMRGTVTEAIES